MTSSDDIGLRYWLRWQVPVCALIIVAPAVVALILIRRVKSEPLNSSELWKPCWRRLNPLWLLLYRVLAFVFLAALLCAVVVQSGAFAFYFYTQWTFALVTIYFALGTIISAHGCWVYLKKSTSEIMEKDELLKKDFEDSDAATLEGKNDGNIIKLQAYYNRKETQERAGFWGYLMQIIYQTCAGAVILTDVVFWCVIVPFLTDGNLHLDLLLWSMHSLNAFLLIVDACINSLQFPWFRFTYFVLWSCVYVVFQWIMHACGFKWWPYPFLELATPWAPLWYFCLALVHVPFYGTFALLMKAKISVFSKFFPDAFVGS